MNPGQQDFYKKLRKDVKQWVTKNLDRENKWSDYILAAPDLFHLLCKLSVDKDVPAKKKIKLLAGIAYFISPIDLLPELLLGPIGYLDDISVAAYILSDLVNDVDPQIVKNIGQGRRIFLIWLKQF